MKQTVNFYDFHDAFKRIRPDNFSYEGLKALFDYLEDYEESCGEEMELDVIAICCDFTEDSVQDIADNYSIDLSGCADEEEKKDAVKAFLEVETPFVAETETGFVYRNV
jgi:hypothetical protein